MTGGTIARHLAARQTREVSRMSDELSTVRDIADRYGVSVRDVQAWAKKNGRGRRVTDGKSGVYVFTDDDLAAFGNRPGRGYPKGRPRKSKEERIAELEAELEQLRSDESPS